MVVTVTTRLREGRRVITHYFTFQKKVQKVTLRSPPRVKNETTTTIKNNNNNNASEKKKTKEEEEGGLCNKNTFRDNSEKKEQLEEGKMKERTRQKKTQFNNKYVEKLVPPSYETIIT